MKKADVIKTLDFMPEGDFHLVALQSNASESATEELIMKLRAQGVFAFIQSNASGVHLVITDLIRDDHEDP